MYEGQMEIEFSFTIELEDDEDIEAIAKLTDLPVIKVSNEVWDEKPFLLTDR